MKLWQNSSCGGFLLRRIFDFDFGPARAKTKKYPVSLYYPIYIVIKIEFNKLSEKLKLMNNILCFDYYMEY